MMKANAAIAAFGPVHRPIPATTGIGNFRIGPLKNPRHFVILAKFLKILDRDSACTRIVFNIIVNEFGLVTIARDGFGKVEVSVGDVIVFVPVFDVGEETFLDAIEVVEVIVEVGDGFALAEGIEYAVLDEV